MSERKGGDHEKWKMGRGPLPGGGGEGRGVVKAPPLLEEEDPTSLGGYLEVSETAEESLGSGAVGGVVV